MDLQLYATDMKIENENTAMNVLLKGVDLSLLLGQINPKEILNELDIDEVVAFVDETRKDYE